MVMTLNLLELHNSPSMIFSKSSVPTQFNSNQFSEIIHNLILTKMIKRSIVFVVLLIILTVTISERVHRTREKRQKSGGKTPPKQDAGKAPAAPPGGAAPAADGGAPATKLQPEALGSFAYFPEKVDYRTAQLKCLDYKKQEGKPYKHLTLDDDEKKIKVLAMAKEKKLECIWTGGSVNVRTNEVVHYLTERRMRVLANDNPKSKELPLRAAVLEARKQEVPDQDGNSTGPLVSVMQTIYPWLETVKEEVTCEFLGETCKPRKCNITTPPCNSTLEQTCVIKKQPECRNLMVENMGKNGTTACDASCDTCSILQPSCVVRPTPCKIERDRSCNISPPECKVKNSECTVELPPCTSYQPPCKASHPPAAKDCVFKEDCYTGAPAKADFGCQLRKVKSKKDCPPEEPDCTHIQVCEMPDICTKPRMCRPPVVHCPTPEAFCPPPRIVCNPPEVLCSEPNISCAEPVVQCPLPEVLCTQPKLNCSAPVITCPIITTLCDNPVIDCPPLTVDCPDPIVACEPQIDCVPPVDNGPIDICVKEQCDKCQCTKITPSTETKDPSGYAESYSECSDKCSTVCELAVGT